MIYEFCGIAASGKSTASIQLAEVLTHHKIPFETIATGSFVSSFVGPYRLKKALFAAMKIGLNMVRFPQLSLFFLQQLILHKDAESSIAVLRFAVAMQYHLDHLAKRVSLSRRSTPDTTYVIDGSPWNILGEYPQIPLKLLWRSLAKIYGGKRNGPNTVIVVSDSDALACHQRMFSRENSPLEIKLYADRGSFFSAAQRFSELGAAVNELLSPDTHVIYVDLLGPERRAVSSLLRYHPGAQSWSN